MTLDVSLLERLAILNEECNEVGQVISKCIRHGMDSASPVPNASLGQDTNDMLLHREVADVLVIISFMIRHGDLFPDTLKEFMDKKVARMNKYLHHNLIFPDDIDGILNRIQKRS